MIDHADRLAEAFFSLDRSSTGNDSYDGCTRETPPNRVEEADVDRINASMRARSSKDNWQDLFAQDELDWLAAIAPGDDLLMPEGQWQPDLVTNALIGITGHGRNVSVSTKMLHLKRPRLFPVLDDLVVSNIGGRYYTGKFVARRAARSLEFIEHLRSQALAARNELAEIQGRLAAIELPRTMTRILDALLWMTSPSSQVAPLAPMIARWRDEDDVV